MDDKNLKAKALSDCDWTDRMCKQVFCCHFFRGLVLKIIKSQNDSAVIFSTQTKGKANILGYEYPSLRHKYNRKQMNNKQMNSLKSCVVTDEREYEQVGLNRALTTVPAHMLPGPGGLTTDSGKNDTFTKHGLNDQIMHLWFKWWASTGERG